MGHIVLTVEETKALYRYLKEGEGHWEPPLAGLLHRIERDLYSRMTIEELDQIKDSDSSRS